MRRLRLTPASSALRFRNRTFSQENQRPGSESGFKTQKNQEKGRTRRDTRHRVLSGTTRTSALAPFRIRSYRFQWPSDLLTSWAFEVETLVLGWYIMVETGSVLLLTVMASLQYVGTLVAPVVGMIGDRMGHRDLLAVMRFAYTWLAGTIMILALTGHLAPL